MHQPGHMGSPQRAALPGQAETHAAGRVVIVAERLAVLEWLKDLLAALSQKSWGA